MLITLTGPNSFAIQQEKQKLINNFIAQFGANGVENVSGESLQPNNLPDLLQGASLFSPQRLVTLTDASQNKPLWDALGDWLGKVSTNSVLVIVESNPDKRTKTYKQLKKLSDFKEFAELSESQLISWLKKIVQDSGAEIDQKTASYLVQKVGSDQWQLASEIQKLINYQPKITVATIDRLVEPNLQANVFELLDSALKNKPQIMLGLIAKIRVSEDPYKLFGLLVSQVHTLALVASADSKGTDEIAKEAGVHPFVVRKTLGMAIDQNKISKIIDIVAKLDMQIKTTGNDPWLLLEQALNKIITC